MTSAIMSRAVYTTLQLDPNGTYADLIPRGFTPVTPEDIRKHNLEVAQMNKRIEEIRRSVDYWTREIRDMCDKEGATGGKIMGLNISMAKENAPDEQKTIEIIMVGAVPVAMVGELLANSGGGATRLAAVRSVTESMDDNSNIMVGTLTLVDQLTENRQVPWVKIQCCTCTCTTNSAGGRRLKWVNDRELAKWSQFEIAVMGDDYLKDFRRDRMLDAKPHELRKGILLELKKVCGAATRIDP